MAWETDGRRGVATIGGDRREGFAMLRDAVKRLVAFQSFPIGQFTVEDSAGDQFTITEDQFEPDQPTRPEDQSDPFARPLITLI